MDVWGSMGSCSIGRFCVCSLLPQGWVGDGQDLRIVSRVLAVGGVEVLAEVLAPLWSQVDGWRHMQFWGEEVKCAAGGWERGAVAVSLWRTEV